MPHHPIVWLVMEILDIYFWVIIAAVVSSWLVAFGVVNSHNHFVRRLVMGLHAVTDPVLRPIRRILPTMGGLDLSPMIVCIVIIFAERMIDYYAFKYGY